MRLSPIITRKCTAAARLCDAEPNTKLSCVQFSAAIVSAAGTGDENDGQPAATGSATEASVDIDRGIGGHWWYRCFWRQQ